MKYRDEQGANLTPADVDANFREVTANANSRILATEKGAALGVATLGADGKVPAGQLPASGGGGGAEIGDILMTARTPDATYLPTGSAYLQATYPLLFAEMGIVGNVLDTSNTGWTYQMLFPTFYSRVMDFARSGDNWVSALGGGGSGSAMRSIDDGLTWQDITSDLSLPAGDDMLSVASDGAGKFIIVGVSGLARVSTDNGASWNSLDIGIASNIWAITHTGTHWVAGGAAGLIRRSADGVTWTTAANVLDWVDHVTKLVHKNGVMLGCSNFREVQKSVDNGNNWTAVGSGTNLANFVTITDSGVYIAGTSAGAVWRSTNGGTSWSASTNGTGISDLRAIESKGDTVIIVGEGGATIRSLDAGLTWEVLNFNAAFYPQSTKCVGATWLIGGNDTEVWRTAALADYNAATHFYVPEVPAPVGLGAYVKADTV